MNRVKKMIEIIALAIFATCVIWFLPLFYTRCTSMKVTGAIDKSCYRQLNCPDGYYNQLGTLFFNPLGSVGLNLLYWEDIASFDAGTMAVAGLTYHVLLLLLFGSSISMGIFIPLLYIGACYGRACAILVLKNADILVEDQHKNAFVTTYTMVSSVALLAGVARVLISLTVIMMCSVGITYMVTPFMVATLFAKVVGKAVFGRPGIYDVILEMRVRSFNLLQFFSLPIE